MARYKCLDTFSESFGEIYDSAEKGLIARGWNEDKNGMWIENGDTEETYQKDQAIKLAGLERVEE